MASINADDALKRDWPLANPWLWLGAGVALVGWSLAWTLYFRPIAADGRVIVLAFGLLLASVGVWLRHRDRQTSFIREQMPAAAIPVRLFLGVAFAAAALGVTFLLILALAQRSESVLQVAPACLIWLTVTPVAASASLRCLRRKDGQPLVEVDEEIAAAFAVLAGCCFLGMIVLVRDPSDLGEWDSLRMFLRVGAFVSAYAAGLIVIQTGLRRLMLSLLFVLHFAGISSAALAAPPSSWIVNQAWMRVFRPYLEFMYLNNAYHFYAPDPGPSSFLWFRIIYTTDDGATDFGKWLKVPDMDSNGRINHPVALEYQRYLSMVEQIVQKDPLPGEFVFNEQKGEWQPNPLYLNRLNLSDPTAPVPIGKIVPKHPRIPLHPEILKTQQVNIPSDGPRRLLSSFARHIALRYPTHTNEQGEELKFKSVKIYRVIHSIPPIIWFQRDLTPTDPTLYQPFYVGNFNKYGTRMNDGDPYLFWLLPILRVQANNPHSQIKDWCRVHAGDPESLVELKHWK